MQTEPNPFFKEEGADVGPEPGLPFLNARFEAEGLPWAQVAGYVVSLVLTFGALLLVVDRLLPPLVLLAVILLLAVGQAALQLGVFMHLRESRGTAWQIVPLGLGFVIAVGLIGMSIWIMLFKSGVS